MATTNASLRRSSRLLAASIPRKESGVATVTATNSMHVASASTSAEKARPAKRAKTQIHSVTTLDDFDEEHPGLVASSGDKPQGRTKAKATAIEYKPEDFPPRESSVWRVGPHVSAAGGVENTVLNAASLGATAFALFVKSQRKWTSSELTPASVTAFHNRLKDFGYDPKHILPHGSYLVNLGNPDEEKREKSYECFVDDLKRCEKLGLFLYNFHPGSTVGQVKPDVSLSLIAQCLNRAHKETERIVTVIENMAGSGNVLGSKFSELGKIISEVNDKSRVGVCLDTCHMFAAGYDIRTREGWDQTMAEFERDVGLKYLRGMHLNDSKAALGSHKDRHENIGMGHLGLETFLHILNDPRTQDIPLIMETPAYAEGTAKGKNKKPGDGWEVWKKEVEILKRLSSVDSGVEQNFQGWGAEIQAVITEKSGSSDKTEKTKNKAKAKKGKRAKRKRDEDEAEHEDEAYESSCHGDEE